MATTHPKTTVVFYLDGVEKPWEIIRGRTPPKETLWEVCAYPSLRSAIGHTFEDAREKLVGVLRAVLSDVDDWYAWYNQEYDGLDASCRARVDSAISAYHRTCAPQTKEWIVDPRRSITAVWGIPKTKDECSPMPV